MTTTECPLSWTLILCNLRLLYIWRQHATQVIESAILSNVPYPKKRLCERYVMFYTTTWTLHFSSLILCFVLTRMAWECVISRNEYFLLNCIHNCSRIRYIELRNIESCWIRVWRCLFLPIPILPFPHVRSKNRGPCRELIVMSVLCLYISNLRHWR